MTSLFLTPDEIPSTGGEPYTITVHPQLLRYIRGALAELTEAGNWEEYGPVTPEDAANYFLAVTYGLDRMQQISLDVLRLTGASYSQTANQGQWTQLHFTDTFTGTSFATGLVDANYDTIGAKILVDGLYDLYFRMRVDALSAATRFLASLYKNTSTLDHKEIVGLAGTYPHINMRYRGGLAAGDEITAKWVTASTASESYQSSTRLEIWHYDGL